MAQGQCAAGHRKPSACARSCQRHRPCELQTSVGDLTIDCEHTDKIGMAVSMARKNVSVRCCLTLESGRCSASMWWSSSVFVKAWARCSNQSMRAVS